MAYVCVKVYLSFRRGEMFVCVFVCISVGRPKHVRVMAGGLEGDTFIGPTAEVRVTMPTAV